MRLLRLIRRDIGHWRAIKLEGHSRALISSSCVIGWYSLGLGGVLKVGLRVRRARVGRLKTACLRAPGRGMRRLLNFWQLKPVDLGFEDLCLNLSCFLFKFVAASQNYIYSSQMWRTRSLLINDLLHQNHEKPINSEKRRRDKPITKRAED